MKKYKYLILYIILRITIFLIFVGLCTLFAFQWPLFEEGYVQAWVPALTFSLAALFLLFNFSWGRTFI